MSDTQELSDIGVPCPSAPERIWLQVDPEPVEEGTAVYAGDDTTWCADKINSNDTLYIRADIALLARASVPTEAQTKRCHWPDCPHGEECVHAAPQSAPDGGDARDGASSDETKEIERG